MEDAAAVGADLARLAVHLPLRAHDAPPSAAPMLWWPRHTPRIGSLPAKCCTAGTQMPASAGEQGPGDSTSCSGRERLDALERDLVVAEHAHVLAELAEILHQVEGEAVVVVDHQQHVRSILLISLDVLSSSTFDARLDDPLFVARRGRRDVLGGDLGRPVREGPGRERRSGGWLAPTPTEERHRRRGHREHGVDYRRQSGSDMPPAWARPGRSGGQDAGRPANALSPARRRSPCPRARSWRLRRRRPPGRRSCPSTACPAPDPARSAWRAVRAAARCGARWASKSPAGSGMAIRPRSTHPLARQRGHRLRQRGGLCGQHAALAGLAADIDLQAQLQRRQPRRPLLGQALRDLQPVHRVHPVEGLGHRPASCCSAAARSGAIRCPGADRPARRSCPAPPARSSRRRRAGRRRAPRARRRRRRSCSRPAA